MEVAKFKKPQQFIIFFSFSKLIETLDALKDD
jgi:hypothetical protein